MNGVTMASAYAQCMSINEFSSLQKTIISKEFCIAPDKMNWVPLTGTQFIFIYLIS